MALDEAATVHFSDLYFPGWSAKTDGVTPLELRAGGDGGLLTLDLLAGEYTVLVSWAGTPVQMWGRIVSLITLLLFSLLLLWWGGRWRWLAVAPFACLVVGVVASWAPLPATESEAVQAQPAAPVRLLGYTTQQVESHLLEISPYWYIIESLPDLRFRWRLTDAAGATLSETFDYPYANAVRSDEWQAGEIVDDRYTLALPPGLPAGEYSLELGIDPVDGVSAQPPTEVGAVLIERPVPDLDESASNLKLRFGDDVLLDSYELQIDGRPPVATTSGRNPIVAPGDQVDYTLFWKTVQPAAANYHGFVHLVDADQGALAQQDQLPGPRLAPPFTWNAFYATPDIYRLEIPEDAASGLYWPRVGLYNFETGDRLPITDAAGAVLGDGYDLPPIKVVNSPDAAPDHAVGATFEGLGELVGYSLEEPLGGLIPGTELTLTLVYRSAAATPVDYTQFVHLYNPELGMAAQLDAQPRQGGNPTSAWVPGERVMDEIVLQIAEDAVPGAYRLQMGLYDADRDATRLPVLTSEGQRFVDDVVVLTELHVQ
ncbi:MAG: hypothetical protein HC802_12300 [Caldilineaceae bacterium]|nr:hypothetical protein [Caldilineaceae bacterium]